MKFSRKDLVLEVMKLNKIRQQEAARLNARAGSQVFPVFTREGLKQWIAKRLEGARRLEDVEKPLNLLLLPLDAKLIDLVEAENPKKVEVLGEMKEVSYTITPPQICFDSDFFKSNKWLDLLDQVVLPSGRLVQVRVAIDWSSYDVQTDLKKLKSNLTAFANAAQWSNWNDKPEIPVPVPADAETVLPEITTAIYGQCVISGKNLVAYGTVSYSHSFYSGSSFSVKWFKSQEEAEATRKKTVEAFEAEQLRLAEQQQVEAEKKKAEKHMASIARHHYESREKCSSETWPLLCDLRNSYAPKEFEKLKEYNKKTEAVIAQVEADISEFNRKKELELQKREQLSEILRRDYAQCPICNNPIQVEIDVPPTESDEGTCFCDCLQSGYEKHGICDAVHADTVNTKITQQLSGIRGNITVAAIQQTHQADKLIAEVVAYYKWGSMNVRFRTYQQNFELDGPEIETKFVWKKPGELELKLAELKQIRDQYNYDRERAEAQVTDDEALKLIFQEGKHPKTSEAQIEAENNPIQKEAPKTQAEIQNGSPSKKKKKGKKQKAKKAEAKNESSAADLSKVDLSNLFGSGKNWGK